MQIVVFFYEFINIDGCIGKKHGAIFIKNDQIFTRGLIDLNERYVS